MIESTNYRMLNHSVLLVGYTPTSWIIKNSWGTKFGQNGYIEISRIATENCGIGFFVASTA
jgi:cathepsin L